MLPDGSVTVHDNGSGLRRPPRAVRFEIDETANTAMLLEDVRDPDAPGSHCCGSTRRLPGGNWVSAWGAHPYVTEQTGTGTRVFKLSFLDRLFSYRADPVLPGELSRAALRAGMDAQYPREDPPREDPPPEEPPPEEPPPEEPPPEEPPPDDTPPLLDTSPPDFGLSGKKVQRLGKVVKVKATCDEPCQVGATGKVVVRSGAKAKAALRAAKKRLRVRLKPASTSLAAGEKQTLSLKLSKKKLKKVKRAMKAPKAKANAKAKLKISATDSAGNKATEKRTVKLKR